MSRERPILFNGAMVRAILAGQKTQTRRAIKGVPSWMHFGKDIMDWDLSGIHQCEDEFEGTDQWCLDVQTDVDDHSREVIRCPFGHPGDRLWVRETWGIWDQGFDTAEESSFVVYRADTQRPEPKRWRPSIQMPREHSRLLLEITDVRVERLQAISEADALAEGIEHLNRRYTFNGGMHESRTPVDSFRALWASTGGDWDANPWVWVIAFKRVAP